MASLVSCADKSEPTRVTKRLGDEHISLDSLTNKACAYLRRQQDLSDSIYHISTYQNWYYDQATGKLTFSSKGLPELSIDYEEVGTVSFKSNTWLWAWDNSHTKEKVKSDIVRVRDFGIKRGKGFEKLIQPYWAADQYDGWDMTAIAAYLMQAKGSYRVPLNDGKLYSFMIFKAIHRADPVPSKP